jgi:hypothetical protein
LSAVFNLLMVSRAPNDVDCGCIAPRRTLIRVLKRRGFSRK